MRILCITTMRNEGPYILEWIAHMKGAGVTDFLVFSNDCEDGTEEILNTLQAHDEIEHIPLEVTDNKSPQWLAMRQAWQHPKRKECDWAIVCDVDEFPNIHVGDRRFQDCIERLDPDVDAIVLPWRLFGNNGHNAFTKNLVTQDFTRSSSETCEYPISATFFKTLFRISGPFNKFGIHRPKQKTNDKAKKPVFADGSGNRMPERFSENADRLSLFGAPIARDWIECNHYSVKSAQSFMVKRARGLPNRREKAIDLFYWVDRNLNSVVNTSIEAMHAQTKPHYDRLVEISSLADLQISSTTWHRKKFEELIKIEEEHSVFASILTAGSSQEISQNAAYQLVKWFQENWQRKQNNHAGQQ